VRRGPARSSDGRLRFDPHADVDALPAGRHRIGRAVVLVPERPAATLVFFHGAGGDAGDSERRVGAAALDAGVALLCPGSSGRTWDLLGGTFGEDLEVVGDLLTTVARPSGVAGLPVSLGGFSDGASYALSVGLANGDLVEAILAFSPGFAAPPRAVGAPRVFLSHGVADAVLPVACTRRISAALRSAAIPAQVMEFAGGHEMPSEVVAAGLRLLCDGPPAESSEPA
jgi:phospholipase/carboxylesterase